MPECINCGDEEDEGERIGPHMFYCTDCLSPVSEGMLDEKEVETGEQFGYRK